MKKLNLKNIFILIMQHVDFLDRLMIISEHILMLASKNDLEKLNESLANRQRLIDLIKSYQDQIEIKLTQTIEVERETKDILDAWTFDINMAMTKMNKMDQIVVEYLKEQKHHLSLEIAQNYINKEKIRGYNLNQTK